MEPTPNHSSFPEEDNLDIKRYISLFISNWYWFAIALFIALSLAYGINRYSEKIWTVSSTLLIKEGQSSRSLNDAVSVIPGGDIFSSQQNLINEMGILRSFMLNYQVMNELRDFQVVYVGVGRRRIVEKRMYNSCPFKVVYDSMEPQAPGKVGIKILSDSTFLIKLNGNRDFEQKKRFGERFAENGFDFTIVPRFPNGKVMDFNSSNNYFFYFVNPENLANEYRGKLSVYPIEKDASLITLSVSGFVPEQEADYLNKLMDIYVNYGLENKSRTAKKTFEFIEKQLNVISDSLKKAERNMEIFRKENSFFEISRAGAIIQNRLEKFESSKSSLELQLQYYNYLAEYLEIKDSGETIISPSVMGISDQVLLRLVAELSQIQKDRERLGFNIESDQLAPGFMDRQEVEIRESLKENVRNGIANLNISLEDVEKKIASVEDEIKGLPAQDMMFIKVQREFDINNTVYTYLLEKRAETGIASASIVSDNREIDSASASRASMIKPKTRKNYIVAIILGLMFPMAGIALIDYFNDKIVDKRDIERRTNVPIIGYISHSEGKNEIPVVDKPGSSLAESFRSVRTSLKYFMKEDEKPVIVVSSAISSEGKTFISVNIAAIIAMLGKKVLLIGLDLRKPGINKIFEFEGDSGMSTYLSRNCEYKEVIKQTHIDNLYYAPSGPIPPNPAELIDTLQMKKFIEAAKDEFDYVIIDTPPAAIVTDAVLLAPYVDINLFIVRQRYSSKNTIDLIEQLNRQGNLKNLAIIVNDINLSGYYGYGMRYGYTMGYGYSYGYNYYGKGGYGKYGYSDKSKEYYTDEG